jgi:quercetin dioxygenase-like cupin family protein
MVQEERPRLDQVKMSFDIPHELRAMKTGEQWKTSGRGAKTLVKNDALRIVLVGLAKGMRLEEHAAEGAITVAVAEGSVRFTAGGEDSVLAAGALLMLAGGVRHGVEALEESAIVVTVAQPHRT